jgi:hypothetical protein
VKTRVLRAGAPLIALALTAWVGASCRGRIEVAGSVEPVELHARQFIEPPREIVRIGGAANDSALLQPRVIALSRGVLYAFDQGDFCIKAFSATGGQRLWLACGSGEGPGEFRNPWQIVGSPVPDEIWVVDPALARASAFRDGVLVRTVSLSTVSRALG